MPLGNWKNLTSLYELKCWAARILWLRTFGLLLFFLRPQPFSQWFGYLILLQIFTILFLCLLVRVSFNWKHMPNTLYSILSNSRKPVFYFVQGAPNFLFLTLLSMFGNVIKQCLSCLMCCFVNYCNLYFLIFWQTRNEPKNIHISCEAISRIKGIPMQTVYEETTKNALKLFPKLHRFVRK